MKHIGSLIVLQFREIAQVLKKVKTCLVETLLSSGNTEGTEDSEGTENGGFAMDTSIS